VRIMLVGEHAWQIRLTGDGWLRSIHHHDAAIMDTLNPLLLEDARALARRFNFAMVGVDYMIAPDGTPRLLEVNHIPNVTVFTPVREAFLELAATWCADPRTDWT
jgi:D-alanine-D-alanine ligase-like ATP-grasp enzyme